MGVKHAAVEARNLTDAALFGSKSGPELLHSGADTGDRTDSGDDGAPVHWMPAKHTKQAKNREENLSMLSHTLVSFACFVGDSTKSFMHLSVWVAPGG